MTYKNCIHYEVCNAECGELLSRINQGCEQCKNFKDKSLIIELPCKVGDEAYYLTYKSYNPLSYKVAKAKVIKFYIDRSGIFDIKFQALKSNFTFRLPICKVFFEKSKAEAKLKELNEK